MSAPPAYSSSSSSPPAGLRTPLSANQPLPTLEPAPFTDLDRSVGVYVASAILTDPRTGEQSVQPCKFRVENGRGKCMYSYGGQELEHKGRFDLLPLTSSMEYVPTSHGQLPKGRRPVEGGFEGGGHLWHAVTTIDGVKVPGKSGGHLHGANFPWGGGETVKEVDYEVLCWR